MRKLFIVYNNEDRWATFDSLDGAQRYTTEMKNLYNRETYIMEYSATFKHIPPSNPEWTKEVYE